MMADDTPLAGASTTPGTPAAPVQPVPAPASPVPAPFPAVPSTEPEHEEPGAEVDVRDPELRKILKVVRDEAAKRRIENRDLKAALDAEKQAREMAEQKALDAQKAAQRQQIATQAAEKYGLPAGLAARLQGSTPEEIDADAQALAADLAKLNPTRTRLGHAAGGSDPGNLDWYKQARGYPTKSSTPFGAGGVQSDEE